MTKNRSAKRALLMSGLALIMCVAMLAGSTFAWFTDSVTSAGNKIQAGTLQVDLELLGEDNTTWTSIKESQKAIFDYENWEPGYTDVKILRVSNKGTLALKWLAKFVSNYELSALADVIDVYVNTEISSYPTDRTALDGNGWNKVGTVRQFVNTISATTKGTLEADASANLGIALKMQETAGNEYQGMDLGGTFDIQIIATQYTAEEDSFDKNYDMNAAIYVDSKDAAQAALDNAKKGDVIVLASGEYGTLNFSANPGHSNTTQVDIANAYKYDYVRSIEDVTILGTTGAKVDGIIFKTGAQPGDWYVTATVKNLVIDGIEFTDALPASTAGYNAPVMITTSNATVDGLTVKNCKLIGNNAKLNLVYLYGADGAKNVTLTGNTVDGIARLCELRGTENVTITNNVIKNTAEHGMLLAGAGYSGNVTITNNTAYGIGDRFVRMAGAGDAVVVIKDNTINAYKGADADYIKVTNGNNVTVENNTITYGSTEAVQAALDNAVSGATIKLAPGVNCGTLYIRPTDSNVTSITCFPGLCDYTTTSADAFRAHWTGASGHVPYYKATIENVTIVGADGATIAGIQAHSRHTQTNVQADVILGNANLGTQYTALNISNLTFKDVAFTGQVNIESSLEDAVYDGVTFDGCSFTTGGTAATNSAAIRYYNESNSNGNVRNIIVKDCTFKNCRQGVYTHHVNGITVTGCTFDTIGHNAVAVQAHSNSAHGNVVITGNTFKNVTDRVIRFNKVETPTTITIQNNVAINSGDDGNEVMKATSIADGVTTSISNNNWGVGKIVVNDQLKDQ